MMMNKKIISDEEKAKDFVADFRKFYNFYKKDAKKIKRCRECFWEKYPEIFNDCSENEVEMDVDIDTTMRTKPPIDREEKLRKIEEKLLSKGTNERFTNYDGVMSDDSLSQPQKIIHLQKPMVMQREERFSMPRYKDNYLKNAFINQRKFMEKLWWKQRVQDGGLNFYENYIDLFWNTVKLYTALFL